MQARVMIDWEGEVVAEGRMGRVAFDQLFLRGKWNVGESAERNRFPYARGVKFSPVKRIGRQHLPQQRAESAVLELCQLFARHRLDLAAVERLPAGCGACLNGRRCFWGHAVL